MDRDDNGHGPRCMICQRFFTPDPRQGARQKCCGREPCRREYKKLWRQKKYTGNEGFRRKEKTRVRRWRWNHPGYWRRPKTGPGVDADAAQVSEVQAVLGTVVRLEQTVAGLISETSGCRDRDALECFTVRCTERGQRLLSPEARP